MVAWIGVLTAFGLCLALLLGVAVLAGAMVALALRRRGPIWHVDAAARRRRRREGWVFAVGLAAVIGPAVGWVLPWPDPPGIGRAAAMMAGALAILLGGAWQMRCLAARIRLGEALLDETGAPPVAMPLQPPPTPGRRIVILCDGTGNRPPDPDDPTASNIWKIRQALAEDETQTVWYDPGVGTGTSRPARALAAFERWSKRIGLPGVSWVGSFGGRLSVAFEGMTGTGIGENILDGYREIVRQYRPGDRIYILGFSRGAYTARCLAGVVARCGVLKAGNARYAPAVVDLYRARRGLAERVPIRPQLVHRFADAAQGHPHVPIEMLGVFDTVASLGAPLWGWWFTIRGFRNLALSTNPVPNCRHVYHALAMDERRATFFPTLFWRPPEAARGWNETLLQSWFRGAHADIGGGYAETGISDITLGWMLGHARDRGLSLKPGTLAALKPDPLARLHDETTRQPFWQLMGTWPRWARLDAGPPSASSGIEVHGSVFARAAAVAATGRLDLHDLDPGAAEDFVTEAHRQWDRTGLVIRGAGSPDAWYRLTYRGGCWRDKDGPPCGPAGEAATEGWRDPRWWFRGRRRVPGAGWMTLCATIAGPQRWKLRELPLRLALRFLFRRGPRLLLAQVAPLGESLTAPGASVLLRSDRWSDGMLYVFANDLWQTVGNNSGAIDLTIERLAGDPGGAEPLWHLPRRGGWQRYDGGARPGQGG